MSAVGTQRVLARDELDILTPRDGGLRFGLPARGREDERRGGWSFRSFFLSLLFCEGCDAALGARESARFAVDRDRRSLRALSLAPAGSGTCHGAVAGALRATIAGGGVPVRGRLRTDRRFQASGSGASAGVDENSLGPAPGGRRADGEGRHLRIESCRGPDAGTGRSLDRACTGSRGWVKPSGSSGAWGATRVGYAAGWR